MLNCTSDLAGVWEWNGGIFLLVNVLESRSLYHCRVANSSHWNSFTNLTWLRDFKFPHRIQISQKKIVKYFGHSKILKPEFSGEDGESWSSLEQGRREPSRAPWSHCSSHSWIYLCIGWIGHPGPDSFRALEVCKFRGPKWKIFLYFPIFLLFSWFSGPLLGPGLVNLSRFSRPL